MNSFDQHILLWVNQFAHRWYLLDVSIHHLAWSNLAKGTPFVMVMTWLWVHDRDSRQRNREIVVAIVIATLCAIIIGRLAANGLPFRFRPMSRTDIDFVLPYGVAGENLRFWSAFPSDTAMVFSALATGLCFASLRLGLAAHAYAMVLIYLPRLYLGMHHPTDILAGGLLGMAMTLLLAREQMRRRLVSLPLRLAGQFPTAFAIVAVFMALQLGTMFHDVLVMARGSRLVGRAALCRIKGGTGCTDPRADEMGAAAAAARSNPTGEESAIGAELSSPASPASGHPFSTDVTGARVP